MFTCLNVRKCKNIKELTLDLLAVLLFYTSLEHLHVIASAWNHSVFFTPAISLASINLPFLFQEGESLQLQNSCQSEIVIFRFSFPILKICPNHVYLSVKHRLNIQSLVFKVWDSINGLVNIYTVVGRSNSMFSALKPFPSDKSGMGRGRFIPSGRVIAHSSQVVSSCTSNGHSWKNGRHQRLNACICT